MISIGIWSLLHTWLPLVFVIIGLSRGGSASSMDGGIEGETAMEGSRRDSCGKER